ncbi:MAG: bifunctional nuclease family protein [Coriobacteriales bacterium]|nr:bifunctional nuclease family protein [Coriobacteriales bacterium]
MVRVEIAGLSLDPRNNQPVLILRPLEGGDYDDRLLPIWIGHAEAAAIVMAIEGEEPPRPMTHDLMRSVIESLDAIVERVEITRVEEGTFYAALILHAEERLRAVDARPSDSIALAVRVGCPIFVAEPVLAEASVPVSMVETQEAEPEEEVQEEQIEEFREFLENVNPADFQE